jgi:hypothetical protein
MLNPAESLLIATVCFALVCAIVLVGCMGGE